MRVSIKYPKTQESYYTYQVSM